MSDSVQVAWIVAGSGMISSFLTYLSNRASAKRSAAVQAQIAEVHDSVDGKMEQLIKVSGDARQAKGKLDGLAEAKEKQERA